MLVFNIGVLSSILVDIGYRKSRQQSRRLAVVIVVIGDFSADVISVIDNIVVFFVPRLPVFQSSLLPTYCHGFSRH